MKWQNVLPAVAAYLTPKVAGKLLAVLLALVVALGLVEQEQVSRLCESYSNSPLPGLLTPPLW